MIQILNKICRVVVAIAGLVIIVYFGILIYKQLKPQTEEQKIMRCLELGSDQRATACLHLLTDKPPCHFEILDVKEYSGRYGELGAYYKIYKGIIKNTSDKKEYLKSMIGKFYTADRTLIKTGYTSIDEEIDSGVSVPFEINILSDSETLGVSWDSLEKDIYPWFTTCD